MSLLGLRAEDFEPPQPICPRPVLASSGICQHLQSPFPDYDGCSSQPQGQGTGRISPIFQSGRTIPAPPPAPGIPLAPATPYFFVVVSEFMTAGSILVEATLVHAVYIRRVYLDPIFDTWEFDNANELRWRINSTPFETELEHFSPTSPPADDAGHPGGGVATAQQMRNFAPGGAGTLEAGHNFTVPVLVNAQSLDLVIENNGGSATGPIHVELWQGTLSVPGGKAGTLLAVSATVETSSLGAFAPVTFGL